MGTKAFLQLAGGALDVHTDLGAAWPLSELCGFASRQNPKRAFLFVSKVLGKHIPVRPSTMTKTHEYLAARILPLLKDAGDVLFLGFAETATGLGAGVFEACLRQAPHRFEPHIGLFVQTTRFRFNRPTALEFLEEHSHAAGHLVYQPRLGDRCFHRAETVVLIDDELSTGRTSANFMKAFLRVNPHVKHIILVSLLNWMSKEAHAALRYALPAQKVSFVSAANGSFFFTPDPSFACPKMPAAEGNHEPKDDLIPHSYGRWGETSPLELNLDPVIQRLCLDPFRPVHVLGDGEFMHPPYLLARHLETRGYDVRVQSTTRSPILLGLDIQHKVTFPDHYEEGIDNHIYNLPQADAQLVLVHESAGTLHLARRMPGMRTVAYKELLCS